MNNNIPKPNIDTTWKNVSNGSPAKKPLTAMGIIEEENILDPFEEAEIKAKPSSSIEQSPFINPSTQPISKPAPSPKIKMGSSEPENKPLQENPLEKPVLSSPTIKPSIEPVKPQELPPETPGIIEPKSKPAMWKTVLKGLAFFIGIFLFIYLFLNFPAVYAKIKYTISPPKEIPLEKIEEPENTAKSVYPTTDQQLFSSFSEFAVRQPIKYVPPAPEPEPTPTETTEPSSGGSSGSGGGETSARDNMLIIPKLGKKIPIVWNSPPDEGVMLENLQRGIVHYAGTALPGEGKGPIFISGHSSYYWWDKGKYKTVFANLDRLEPGDDIQITYNGNVHTYRVFETIVVMPDQVDVLNQVNEPILALMTCVPVGTNQKRLIVKAKEI